MKQKIKEVHDYFKNKLLENDCEIIEMKEHTCKVSIDKEYNFTIWTGNFTYPDHCKLYSGSYNFIHINFSSKESKKLHSNFKSRVNKFKKETLLKEKQKEVETLQKQLETLAK